MKLYFSNPEKKVSVRAFFGYALAVVPIVVFAINIWLYGYSTELNNAIAIFTVVLSVYLCYVFRFNIGLFFAMIFIAYTNYSVAVGVYLFPEIRPSALYAQFWGVDLYGKAILCTLIFESVFILLSHRVLNEPHSIELKHSEHSEKYENNIIIAWGALVVYAIMFFSVFRFSDSGERSTTTAINEYRIIVAIIGCYYSGKKKTFKIAWTILIGFTSALTMLGGNRANMFGSMFLLLVFWYSEKITYKKVLILLPFVVIILAAVGFERGNFVFSGAVFRNAWSLLRSDKLTYEGAIIGYLPSLSTIFLTDRCDFQEKMDLLIRHIVYVFKIGSAGTSNPDLVFWSREYFVHYNGYISPSYFYIWFKHAGPAIFALIVNGYVKMYNSCIHYFKLNKFLEKLKYILSLWFLCTFTRWYTYGPMTLIRGAFVCSIVFFIVYWINDFIEMLKHT